MLTSLKLYPKKHFIINIKLGHICHQLQSGNNHYHKLRWDWRGDSVRSTGCSYRESRFCFQQPHGSSHPSIIPIPKDLTSSLDSKVTRLTHSAYAYMQEKHTQKMKIKNFSFKNQIRRLSRVFHTHYYSSQHAHHRFKFRKG